MNQSFTFFDENGAAVSLTGSQIVNTVSQLGYRYDDDPLIFWPYFWPFVKLGAAVDEPQKVVSSQEMATIPQGVKLTDTRQDVRIALPKPALESLAAARGANFANERIILQLQDIQYDRPVGVSYMLFLNLPPDADRSLVDSVLRAASSIATAAHEARPRLPVSIHLEDAPPVTIAFPIPLDNLTGVVPSPDPPRVDRILFEDDLPPLLARLTVRPGVTVWQTGRSFQGRPLWALELSTPRPGRRWSRRRRRG